jgi:hypothetical protein
LLTRRHSRYVQDVASPRVVHAHFWKGGGLLDLVLIEKSNEDRAHFEPQLSATVYA